MSTWRLAAKALHERGGMGLPDEVSAFLSGAEPYGPLMRLVRMGLATSTGRQGGGKDSQALYMLTPKGVALMEGRLAVVRRPDKRYGRPTKKMIFIATWIDSLPRGIRLDPAPGQRILEQRA